MELEKKMALPRKNEHTYTFYQCVCEIYNKVHVTVVKTVVVPPTKLFNVPSIRHSFKVTHFH